MKKIILILLIISSFSFSHKERWDENRKGWSPLMLAIYEGKTEVFTSLINNDADVNYSVDKGYSDSNEYKLDALDVAIKTNNLEAAKQLIATNKIKNLQSYFLEACSQQNVAVVELLIKNGVNLNSSNLFGHSALMSAVSFGSNEILELLLKNNADVNYQRNGVGMSALMFAAYGFKIEKAKLLLKYGADKQLKNKQGKTAFDYVDRPDPKHTVSEQAKLELKKLLE